MVARPEVLLLGGTADAADFARLFCQTFGSSASLTVSYAGVTKSSPDLPCRVRVGGFGGREGLKSYLIEKAITCVVDATHPFAAQMSKTAYEACQGLGLPLFRLERPAWVQQDGDDWIFVPDMQTAAQKVKEMGRATLLTTGVKDLPAFANVSEAPIVARLIQEPKIGHVPENMTVILSRPPYDLETEKKLLSDHAIELLVTKNSGGALTEAKIIAARDLGVKVVMVDRPVLPTVPSTQDSSALISMLSAVFG